MGETRKLYEVAGPNNEMKNYLAERTKLAALLLEYIKQNETMFRGLSQSEIKALITDAATLASHQATELLNQ